MRVSGLAWRAGLAAAAALVLTGGALATALSAAADARDQSRELSGLLVPAAAMAGVLLGDYQAQQSALRDYVTSGQPAGLASFRLAGAQVPAAQARLAALVGGYPRMPGQLAAAEAAQRAWLARVAAPQLAAAGRGDFARARLLQNDIPRTRPYTLAVRNRMAALQAQVTAMQGRVTSRLVSRQSVLLAALIAVCAVVAAIVAAGAVAVWRWLLRPLTGLRRAADAVAAGDYATTIPVLGPPELADLGRSVELMRTRLVGALAAAGSAEQRFRRLFDAAPDATLTVSPDASIVMANTQAEQLFGYSTGELAGQPVEVLIPGAMSRTEEFRAQLSAQPVIPDIIRTAVSKDGRQIPVEITASALPADPGAMAVVSFRDISERLAAQAKQEQLRGEADRERYARRLVQSERLESLGQLVGGVAHDFNNLLNVIAGYTDFTARELEALAPSDQRLVPVLDDLGQVRDATGRATRLTRQLLTFGRRDVVHPEVLDLGQIIAGVEQLLRRTLGEHITLVIAPGAGTWPVKADAGQLEQVLVNLAVNARDAMPSGGTLTIETSNIDADEAYTATQPDIKPGRYARLRVSDTGSGMKPEVLARVLEPFYTTKAAGQGTGLGLATVYGILTRAGGSLHIYSEPGLGTTVSALLPATSETAAPARAECHAAAATGRGETILLTEDEESLRELTRRILTRHGYRVRAAISPADAISQAGDRGQPIDLMLTDVVMPSMLGNELADRIHNLRPGLPVLFMSGYAPAMLDTQGALAGHTDLLEKPFSENTILRRVRDAIDNRTA